MRVQELLRVIDSTTLVEIYEARTPDEIYFNNRQNTIYKRLARDIPRDVPNWEVKQVRVVNQILKVEVC